jgi:hypothetical protein
MRYPDSKLEEMVPIVMIKDKKPPYSSGREYSARISGQETPINESGNPKLIKAI